MLKDQQDIYFHLESVINTLHFQMTALHPAAFNHSSPATPPKPSIPSDRVILVVVCCSDRLEEASVLFKTSILLSTAALHLVILTDRPSTDVDLLMSTLTSFRHDISVTYEIIPPRYPDNLPQSMKQFGFGACASLRLFLPSLLPHHDKIVYMDSDTLLLQPPSSLWATTSLLTPPRLMAIVEENPSSPSTSFYGCCSLLPSPPPSGLNSGIIAMDLAAMRKSNIETVMISAWVVADKHLILHDQVIINKENIALKEV